MTALAYRIRTLLNIQADESRMAALVVGVMLLTSAGFTLGSTGVETLFFTRYGVEYLPYMYIPLGILTFLTSLGVTALLGRIRHETLYYIIPIGVAVLTVFAWLILFSSWNVIYPILWLGKEIINSLVSLVVWGIAGTVCDTRQSKRLFPLFNAGRILGAVIGGMGTGLLVNQIGTQNLLLVWTGMLLLAFRAHPHTPQRTDPQHHQPPVTPKAKTTHTPARNAAGLSIRAQVSVDALYLHCSDPLFRFISEH